MARAEKPLIQIVSRKLSTVMQGQHVDTDMLRRLDGDQIKDLRALYWDLAGQVPGAGAGEKILVDKMPMNIPCVSLFWLIWLLFRIPRFDM